MAEQQLAKIAEVSDAKQKTDQYKSLIQELAAANNVAGLNATIDALVQESVALVVSRQAIQQFAESIPTMKHDAFVPVAEHALKALQARTISFEEHFSTISEKLANVYFADGKFREAGDLLASIPLDSGQRVVDDKYKAAIYVLTAESYLNAGAWSEADKAVNRASSLERDEKLNQRFRVCFAAMLDYKRKYLDVIRHYFELAKATDNDATRSQFIDSAVICSILSEAGPQRSRWLSVLHKDDFVAKSRLYGILEHVFLERVLRAEEVQQFATFLKPHQVAKRDDGFSDLDTAMVQHNLLAASRIYNNITFEQMGGLLQIPAEKAEKMTSQMIMTNRLAASIDQIEGLVTFDSSRNNLALWDTQIEGTCFTVDRVVSLIGRSHPSLVGQ